MTAYQLAIMVRIYDDPGIHAAMLSLRMPAGNGGAVWRDVKNLVEFGFVREGEKYKSGSGPGRPRTPLYLTGQGERQLRVHLKAIAGIEL